MILLRPGPNLTLKLLSADRYACQVTDKQRFADTRPHGLQEKVRFKNCTKMT